MQKFEEISAQLLPKLEPFERERQGVQSRYRRSMVIQILWLLLFVLMLPTGPFAAIPFIIAILYYHWGLGKAKREREAFRANFKANFVRAVIQAIAPGFSYEPQGCVPWADFEASRLQSKACDRYTGEDLIRGTWGQTAMQVGEVLTESLERDSDGHESYRTVFRGLLMVIDPNKHFENETFIVSKSLGLLDFFKNYGYGEEHSMESPEFNREFRVYSQDPIEARYLITPRFMQQVLALNAHFKGDLRMSFRQGKYYLSLATYHNYFEFDFNQDIRRSAVLQRFYEEFRYLLEVVEILDFNTRIWSKQ